MIETLGTYSELMRHPKEVEDWLTQEGSAWRVTTDLRTGNLTGTLYGEHTGLGRVQVQKPRSEDTTAAYVVMAEGNALTLLHGHGAKSFTLKPADVPAAVDAYRAELLAALPLLSPQASAHRVTRVDASCTWRHSEVGASRALAQARSALGLERSGRKILATYGVETVTLRLTKRHTVRCYDKTAESYAAARAARVPPPDLGPGRLVRLEAQHRSRTARGIYGDNLNDLGNSGAVMARQTVNKTADAFGGQITAGTAGDRLCQLIELGAKPSEAVRLLGASLLIAEGGIPALTSRGVPQSQAYALRARIRELLGEGTSEETDAAYAHADAEQDESDHGENAGLWDVDDAAWAEG